MSVLIVDTKCANLASVGFAFDRMGITNRISDDPTEIRSADRVLIPGVGSAPYAMEKIRAAGLEDTLRLLNQPVLGICLGMQLLFETLEEGGTSTAGLGLVPGHVEALDTGDLPTPHMGWNQLTDLIDDPLTHALNEGDHAYFVHSFAALITNETVATCRYHTPFSAMVRHNNVRGCQFHPERSSQTGSAILKAFATL
ncbi:imidazole glycerol phosphate synthase subunit HisH [Algimonas ampicilliniresistens]|uniref:Imidazole glycerol phosphate synthase subunit HisH n=1 Tax=Algimonas ampicilliniresistens TaxID=1298735 RepID=A0ABQ5V795_9PROT|nr:imidazole glycerol phosphate synthase subunit HisH [Algimonas ampicilliniresistens]GLQ23323.1 imidazole glycerol phosphate synthase subunit HisH [Algimonas ampicilliniresistens]